MSIVVYYFTLAQFQKVLCITLFITKNEFVTILYKFSSSENVLRPGSYCHFIFHFDDKWYPCIVPCFTIFLKRKIFISLGSDLFQSMLVLERAIWHDFEFIDTL